MSIKNLNSLPLPKILKTNFFENSSNTLSKSDIFILGEQEFGDFSFYHRDLYDAYLKSLEELGFITIKGNTVINMYPFVRKARKKRFINK